MSQENPISKQPLIRHVNRQQMSWRAVDVEHLISEDHPARAIWTLVGRLNLSAFYQTIESSTEEGGRPAIEAVSFWKSDSSLASPELLMFPPMVPYTSAESAARLQPKPQRSKKERREILSKSRARPPRAGDCDSAWTSSLRKGEQRSITR